MANGNTLHEVLLLCYSPDALNKVVVKGLGFLGWREDLRCRQHTSIAFVAGAYKVGATHPNHSISTVDFDHSIIGQWRRMIERRDSCPPASSSSFTHCNSAHRTEMPPACLAVVYRGIRP